MTLGFKEEVVFELDLQTESDFEKTHEYLKPLLKPQTLFLLTGDLAAGKTTFIKSLFPEIEITSPTFSIRNTYDISSELQVQHFDLYRLETEDEIASVGIWDVFSEKKSVVFIEWPERVSDDLWPLNWSIYRISLTVNDVDSAGRKMRMTKLL